MTDFATDMIASAKINDLMDTLIQNAIESHAKDIKSRYIMIIVNDDEKKCDSLRSIIVNGGDSAPNVFIFNEVDECERFVEEKVGLDPNTKIIVLVCGHLACDLASSLQYCEQITSIIIMNQSQPEEEVEQLMKKIEKVKFSGNIQNIEDTLELQWPLHLNAERRAYFTEPLSYEPVNDESLLQYVEPVEASFKQVDNNCLIRFFLLMCLQNVPPFQSDQDNLIQLLKANGRKIPEDFQRTYAANKAIHLYTKEPFIYDELNKALRTLNIGTLLPFRFIFQDICNHLNEQNEQNPQNEPLIVYRGQVADQYEIANLFLAYCRKTPLMTTTFFSTSKCLETAEGFAHNLDRKPYGTDPATIIFRITVKKDDRSPCFPFADVSSISQHKEEKEVLFAPGQLFSIDNFNVELKENQTMFRVEMTLNGSFRQIPDPIKSMWSFQRNPLILFGKILIENKLYDEAKELYNKLLLEYVDPDEKYKCYHGLLGIALAQNDEDAAIVIDKKMTQLKFGSELRRDFTDQPIKAEDQKKLLGYTEKVKETSLKISPGRSFDQLIPYLMGTEFQNDTKQILDSVYPMTEVLIQNGIYDQAIQIIEGHLNFLRISIGTSCDPSLIPRYYMRLGHCYHKLGFNEKAVKFYELALEQHTHLSLQEYIQTLISTGTIYEAMKNFEQALYKYIEVAEIYQKDSTVGTSEKVYYIEECIRRVT